MWPDRLFLTHRARALGINISAYRSVPSGARESPTASKNDVVAVGAVAVMERWGAHVDGEVSISCVVILAAPSCA